MSKAQISVEYLMILGFSSVIIIPLILIYYDYTATSNDEIISRQINQIAQKVVDAAESVYYLGEPSQTNLKVHIPNQIAEATIEQERTIVFKMKTKAGISDIVQISSVNLTGSLPITQGIHFITVKAEQGKVTLSYT
ncbi:hypothetical protein ISS05_05635 [Candidatus Woesearchaeota archaeon]|nr:hypothetical protein [Candidatus Woesearchaeota archaeon]